jgi:hypothetical protein
MAGGGRVVPAHTQKGALAAMAEFKADADTLEQHGYLHQRIAAHYRSVYDRLTAGGGSVVQGFNSSEHQDAAGDYQRWLNSLTPLLDQASVHDSWAEYFTGLAQQVRLLEGQFS